MPSTHCPWFDQNGTARYFGTFLATKHKIPDADYYVISIVKSLSLPDTCSLPTVDDLFNTYQARNKEEFTVVAVLEDTCVRIWDKQSRNDTSAEAERLRASRFNTPAGFSYPIDPTNRELIIPTAYVERLGLKRDIIISASYDDLDPGETFCIHRPSMVEKILKKYTKTVPVHQR